MAIVKIIFNTQENSYIVANLLQPDEFVTNLWASYSFGHGILIATLK